MAANIELNPDVLSRAVDEAWCKRKVEGHDEWHAYGWCCFDEDDSKDYHCHGTHQVEIAGEKEPERRLLMLVEPDANVPELKKSIYRKCALSRGSTGKLVHKEFGMMPDEFVAATMAADRPKPPLDVIVAEPFQQPEAGDVFRPSTLLHPGARVFSTSRELGDSTNGTIGAFLKAKGTQAGHPAWLLSNKHVLLKQEQRLESVEVRGAGQTLISREVHFKGLGDTVNRVDAAIAKVIDSDEIEAVYDGIQIHCPHPIEPRLGMKVYKLGNATGVTAGRIICRLNKVFVQDANKRGGFEFRDQYLIASDTTFMASGDSGSLVIGHGHPVALLFAMAKNVKGLPKNRHFVPPFGLACSIGEVLATLPKEGDSEWEIMLDDVHIKHCCCHPTKGCGCHKEGCPCRNVFCLCHSEYCPYYCPCSAGPNAHPHCNCGSGHERHGKECYCEAYHENYRPQPPEPGGPNAPGGHGAGNGGPNGPSGGGDDGPNGPNGGGDDGPNHPTASHGTKSREHTRETDLRHEHKTPK